MFEAGTGAERCLTGLDGQHDIFPLPALDSGNGFTITWSKQQSSAGSVKIGAGRMHSTAFRPALQQDETLSFWGPTHVPRGTVPVHPPLPPAFTEADALAGQPYDGIPPPRTSCTTLTTFCDASSTLLTASTNPAGQVELFSSSSFHAS